MVLHRIVGITATHYMFKGDNNHFLDPSTPPGPNSLGKLWVHVPHGGFVLKALHNPVVRRHRCGCVGLFTLFGASAEAPAR